MLLQTSYNFLLQRINSAGFGPYIARFFPRIKVQKISLATASYCPNVDKVRGIAGCTYCNNAAFSPQFEKRFLPINEQLDKGIDFFKYKYPEMKYLAYFQSYTSTVQALDKMMMMCEQAIQYPGVVGIVLATRPDTMPPQLLSFLAEKAKTCFVLIEYGVESTCDETLLRINRGHTYQQAVDTIFRTHSMGLQVGAHLILGLPGEDQNDFMLHAQRLAELPIDILKLHQLQIVKNTHMAKEYEQNPHSFNLFTPQQYANTCINFLMRIPQHVAIDRFISQSPDSLLIAPKWGIKNYMFDAIMKKELLNMQTQGIIQ